MHPLMGRLLAAGVAIWAAMGLAGGAELPDSVKASFLAGFMKDCIPSATQSAPTASAAVVNAYCTCMADKTVAVITADDIAYIADNKSMPAALEEQFKAFAPACVAQAQSK